MKFDFYAIGIFLRSKRDKKKSHYKTEKSLKTLIAIITAISFAVSTYASTYAHSGRTNQYGCHNNHKTGGYHCHNSGSGKSVKSNKSGGSRNSINYGNASLDIDWSVLAIMGGVLLGTIVVLAFTASLSDAEESTASYSFDADPVNKEVRASTSIKW